MCVCVCVCERERELQIYVYFMIKSIRDRECVRDINIILDYFLVDNKKFKKMKKT